MKAVALWAEVSHLKVRLYNHIDEAVKPNPWKPLESLRNSSEFSHLRQQLHLGMQQLRRRSREGAGLVPDRTVL